MNDTSVRVMNMVRRRILEDPKIGSEQLFAAAIALEPELRHLTMQQFNARYPLQVKRRELSWKTKLLRPEGPLSRAVLEAAENSNRTYPDHLDRSLLIPPPKPQHVEHPVMDGAAVRHAPEPATHGARTPDGTPAGVSSAARPANGELRDRVRATLFRLAGNVVRAETRAEIVRALANIDEYVDEVGGWPPRTTGTGDS